MVEAGKGPPRGDRTSAKPDAVPTCGGDRCDGGDLCNGGRGGWGMGMMAGTGVMPMAAVKAAAVVAAESSRAHRRANGSPSAGIMSSGSFSPFRSDAKTKSTCFRVILSQKTSNVSHMAYCAAAVRRGQTDASDGAPLPADTIARSSLHIANTEAPGAHSAGRLLASGAPEHVFAAMHRSKGYKISGKGTGTLNPLPLDASKTEPCGFLALGRWDPFAPVASLVRAAIFSPTRAKAASQAPAVVTRAEFVNSATSSTSP